MGPLVPFMISNEFNLIIALIAGIGFGFVLEQAGHSEIGSDGENIPKQRTAEIRPHRHLIRNREHVVRNPYTTDMNAGKDERADHGEDRHRFGKAVDGSPPSLPQEKQDR